MTVVIIALAAVAVLVVAYFVLGMRAEDEDTAQTMPVLDPRVERMVELREAYRKAKKVLGREPTNTEILVARDALRWARENKGAESQDE